MMSRDDEPSEVYSDPATAEKVETITRAAEEVSFRVHTHQSLGRDMMYGRGGDITLLLFSEVDEGLRRETGDARLTAILEREGALGVRVQAGGRTIERLVALDSKHPHLDVLRALIADAMPEIGMALSTWYLEGGHR